MNHYFLVSTNELFAQNIFMFWRVENDSVTINHVIEKYNIDILMNCDLISYKVRHDDAHKKLVKYNYKYASKYHSRYPGFWFKGNIHKAYEILTIRTYNLHEQMLSLREELHSVREEIIRMRTAVKELEEYIFNLNAESLKSGITQK